MKEILAALKYGINTLIRKPLIGVLALSIFWGSWGWMLLINRILVGDSKDEKHTRELKAATDITIDAQRQTIEVQQTTIMRQNIRHEIQDTTQ